MNVLDFYSGMGIFHYCLNKILPDCNIYAFDMNENANKLYTKNHKIIPNHLNIMFFPLEKMEEFNADLWMCSPPCQPFTRKNKTHKEDDKRKDSFLYLIECLKRLTKKPRKIIIENVFGFEKSTTFEYLETVLIECGYKYQVLELNPLNFGIPYSRPRIFILCSLDGLKKFAVEKIPITSTVADFVIENVPDSFLVPEKVLSKAGKYFNYVVSSDKHVNCFTKGYKEYAQGCSIFVPDKNRHIIKGSLERYFDWIENKVGTCPLVELQARYFTPREIANFHGIDSNYILDADISLRSLYKILGNSMSVDVVRVCLEHLL
jgi:tRNA (cytosine38-C5)-methyltransferase